MAQIKAASSLILSPACPGAKLADVEMRQAFTVNAVKRRLSSGETEQKLMESALALSAIVHELVVP